ncbi:hypothetical protein [Nonomuraea sp. NPDC048916]|uniref:DUF7158 domain-containing protein n=1 Tax=Nonomuraea sp. NPDC048916 TaxID=3154232 RepID=UPI0033E8B3CA
MIGWVGGRAIPRERLDRRIGELRGGPLAGALPTPGSSEDRQLARWMAQVILTEALCEDEGAARGLAPVEGGPLDRVAAVELGSINASAYNGSPWVRAVFEDVTAAVDVPPEWRRPGLPDPRTTETPPAPDPRTTETRPAPVPRPTPARRAPEARRAEASSVPERPPALARTGAGAERFAVWHGLFRDRARAAEATAGDLEPLGAVTLGSLPAAIARALRAAPEGALVGPVEDPLGWHVAIARPEPVPPPERADDLPEGAARRRAFARWLDQQRAERIRLVPGLEHPGDPRQPDNHHKH